MNKLTKKQKGFADDYIDTGNARLSAKNNYNLGSKGGKKDKDSMNKTADIIANETLKKPSVIAYLEDNAYEASARVVELSKTAQNEATKLNANKDILDRAGYKPADKAINLNVTMKSLDPTNPKLIELINEGSKILENESE